MPSNPVFPRCLPLVFCLWAAGHAKAQLPQGTEVRMGIPDVAGVAKLELVNPGNHTWTVQGSSNLSEWATIGTIKVHNGRLTRNLQTAGPGAPREYYRLRFDPAAQTLSSTVADALRLPGSPANYANPTLPAAFSQQPILGQDNTPQDNPVTDSGAALGRVLFYDKRLSRNHTVSCSSCHQAQHGFSDPRKFSVGFEGGLTDRNSMGLTNARWYARRAFFWDERAATLEDQVLQPIQNSVEMGMTLPDVVARLAAEPYYQTLFLQAFGSQSVTTDRIARALAQFVRSIISTQSKFDQGRTANPPFSNFTSEENLGRTIFTTATLGNCASCHGSDNFVPGPNLNNNGLENPYVDRGRAEVTGLASDEGLFKAPSLRNIELTAPYMHDGRFASLEAVVEFYNSGVVNHPNLSPPLRNPPGTPNQGQPRRLNLTPEQKAALVAFLKTLTDRGVTTDARFQDPFYYGD